MTNITIDKALLEQALDALEHHTEQTRPIHNTQVAMDEIRAALERSPHPQAEPVAWRWQSTFGGWSYGKKDQINIYVLRDGYAVQPLYAAPPASRKPLTDEEMLEVFRQNSSLARHGINAPIPPTVVQIIRATERAHGIKETP